MTRKLTPATESWLRHYIPIWGTLRDQAVAAGLVEPETPALSQAETEKVAKIRDAVKVKLARGRPANQNQE